jgi:hypothetical protein
VSGLPAWAQAVVPVDMDGAAACLGIGRRSLVDVLRNHPHYERRGTRKVFYPEHIALLREAIECQSGALAQKGSGHELSERGIWQAVGSIAGKRIRKSLGTRDEGQSGRTLRRLRSQDSGNVIPMARQRSGTFEEAAVSYMTRRAARSALSDAPHQALQGTRDRQSITPAEIRAAALTIYPERLTCYASNRQGIVPAPAQ